MVHAKHLWTNALRVTLLLLLLSMQSFTLAHEVDRSIVHDGGVCAVCSIGNGHDGAVASNHDCPIQIVACQQTGPASVPLPLEPARYTPEARAPPHSL